MATKNSKKPTKAKKPAAKKVTKVQKKPVKKPAAKKPVKKSAAAKKAPKKSGSQSQRFSNGFFSFLKEFPALQVKKIGKVHEQKSAEAFSWNADRLERSPY